MKPSAPLSLNSEFDLRAFSVLACVLTFPLATSIAKLRFLSVFYTVGIPGKITVLIPENNNRATLEFLTKNYGLPKLLFPSEMMVSTRDSSLPQLLDD